MAELDELLEELEELLVDVPELEDVASESVVSPGSMEVMVVV